MDWAFDQWGSVDIGDQRRTFRAVKLGASLAIHSCASLPVQTGCWAATKAAYRLLNQPEVTHAKLSSPHWDLTRSAAGASQDAVLFVQDGTELNYTHHSHTTGLGFSNDGRGHALELHSVLCVSGGAEAHVMGLAYQAVWTREHAPRKKTEKRSERYARRKESDVWAEVLEAIGRPQGLLWVSVGDRESDIFTYLSRSRALDWHCLVRARHNRRTNDPDGVHLFDRMRSLESQAQTSLHLRARPGAPARDVVLNVCWTQVTLLTPDKLSGEPIPVWCIRAWEDSPDGLEWILLSTLPVEQESQALEKLEWYRRRWLVEEYHKALKTGCSMESRQMASRHGLEALLGFLSVVAVLLLSMKNPYGTGCVPEQPRKVLSALSKKELDPQDPRAFIRQVAMLGGFLGRKSDGEPGWQSIWTGWNRLHDIMLGMEISNGGKCG